MNASHLTVAATALLLAALAREKARGSQATLTGADNETLLPAHLRYDRVGTDVTYVPPDVAAAELIAAGRATGTPSAWTPVDQHHSEVPND